MEPRETAAEPEPRLGVEAVIEVTGDRLVVACDGGTALAIQRLVPAGRRSMSAAKFLRGSPLGGGVRLG